MDFLVEKIESIKGKFSKKTRVGLILLLSILTFVFLFVAGGLANNAILGLIITFIIIVLFLSLEPRRAICGTLIFAFFCISLYLRTVPSHDGVFGGNYVVFTENDPWYHMRVVENMVRHFPQRISFDPYSIYPTGMNVQFAPFFEWLLGFFVWLIGFGHPSIGTIETVGAYFPCVLGALVIIPVYFIGKALFNRTAGLLSAGLIAIMPGEFFFRSKLGFTDHHIAEVLFSTTLVMFFILAIKSAREKEISFSHFHSGEWMSWIRNKSWRNLLRSPEWKTLRMPLFYALLAGVMLGVYLLSWIGGLLFVFIVFAYMLVQYVIDHLRGRSTDYLGVIGVTMFLIALIMVAPNIDLLVYGEPVLGALVIALVSLPVLNFVSKMTERFKLKRIYYPLALAVLGGVGVFIFYLVAPDLYHEMMSKFNHLFGGSSRSFTIMEARPLFVDFRDMPFTSHTIWRYFTTGLFIVPLSLLMIIYNSAKKKTGGNWLLIALGVLTLLAVLIYVLTDMPSWFSIVLYSLYGAIIIVYAYFERSPGRVLLVFWSFVTLVAMISQVRFAYYFAVNAALFSGYLCSKIPGWLSKITEWISSREPSPAEQRKKRKAEKRRGEPAQEVSRGILGEYRGLISYVSSALAAIIVFFLAFYPLIGQTRALASDVYGPNEAWYSSLVWMRENTPDPFGDPDFYYALYEKPKAGEAYDYPESAYGVMSWWDYGHWITRIAHRIPNANPHQIGIGGRTANGSVIPGASTFMTAQNESVANPLLDALGSKYVVIDIETDISKFHTMATWAGDNPSEYFEQYYYQTENGSGSIMFYYPKYYQGMCSRLYNSECESVVPNNSTWVISYTEMTDQSGQKFRALTDVANEGRSFTTYEEAEAFINEHPGYIIVGLHPFMSPVPLEKLEHYKLIHSSDQMVNLGDIITSYVKIFEYTP